MQVTVACCGLLRYARNDGGAINKRVNNIIILKDLTDTIKFASEFALTLKQRDVVLLSGDLGAGKTEIARQIIRTLCGTNTEVPSPTFTLVQEYQSKKFPIYHFDLYRLENKEEIFELSIEDCAWQGVCLIEWPERLQELHFGHEIKLEIRLRQDGVRVIYIS